MPSKNRIICFNIPLMEIFYIFLLVYQIQFLAVFKKNYRLAPYKARRNTYVGILHQYLTHINEQKGIFLITSPFT